MQHKICLITFFNQYESKRHFTAELARSLEKLGASVLLLDPVDGLISDEFKREILAFSPDCLFSYNSTVPDKSGRFLWDYLQIPGWNGLVDPAFYSIGMAKSPYTRFTTVDREDCKWLNDNGVKGTIFLPHGVEASLSLGKPDEKIYDVVFLGTCTDFQALKMQWHQTLNADEVQILNLAIQIMLTPPGNSLLQALALSVSVFASIDPKTLNFQSLFHYLDNFVRGKDRFELIRSIKTAKVHVFGEPSWLNPKGSSSWKQYIGDLPNVILHPPVTYAESFEITKKAKIALNSSPFFRHGSHERILNALMTGAVPLTTKNGFVEEFFSIGEDLITYQPGNWAEANDLVNDLLSNEKKRAEMAEKGRQKVLENHTWDQRAKELLSHL